MNNDSGSRSNRAYTKRNNKKKQHFIAKEVMTKSPHTYIEGKKYKNRDQGNIADHEFTKKYNVSYHSCHRFLSRVFKQTVEATEEDLVKAAIMIKKNIEVDFTKVGEGSYPFMGNFLAIVKNGIVLTIIRSKKEN